MFLSTFKSRLLLLIYFTVRVVALLKFFSIKKREILARRVSFRDSFTINL